MRNRFMRCVILMGALCVTVTAWAADNANAPGNDASRCPNQTYPGKIPGNFSLLSHCPDARNAYTLVGDAEVNGRIVYRYSDVWGMYALFVVSPESMSLLSERFRAFILSNGDLDRFHLPRLLDYNNLEHIKHDCYTANARIRITSLRDDGGATADGPSLGEYEVLSLYNVESHKCGREREEH